MYPFLATEARKSCTRGLLPRLLAQKWQKSGKAKGNFSVLDTSELMMKEWAVVFTDYGSDISLHLFMVNVKS